MPVKSAGSNLTLLVTIKDVRAMALALPEVTESDHWGHPSFRIYGRIFVTVPDPTHLNVMIDPFDVEAAVRENPEACTELCWGKEVRGVQVSLQRGSREVVANLLEVAWRRKAPRRLSAARELRRLGGHGDRKRTALR